MFFNSVISFDIRVFILFLLFFIMQNTMAQDDTDCGVWTDAGVVKEWNNWQFSTVFEFQTREMTRQVNRIAIAFDPSYRITDWLQTGAVYMPMIKWRSNQPEWRHRHYYYILNKVPWKRMLFSLRQRFQFTHMPGAAETETWIVESIWRNRFYAIYSHANHLGPLCG